MKHQHSAYDAALQTRLSRARAALTELLAPRTCIYCSQSTPAADPICDICFCQFQANTDACPRCALPRSHGSLCPKCLNGGSCLDRIIAPYIYDPAVAFLLKRWKFEKQRYCSRVAAKMILNSPYLPPKSTNLLATPLHWRRQLQRGFNQSEDLLLAMVRRSRSEHQHQTRLRLVRRRATDKQSLSSRSERQRNLENAFEVIGDARGKSVVLIDDVCTTGATAESMARSLRSAGATSVSLWCLARTPGPL